MYKKYALELIEKEQAYYCFCSKDQLEQLKSTSTTKRHWDVCTSKNDSEKIAANDPYVIRLKVPQNKVIAFQDLIRGEITINSDQFDDQVLLKSDGYPTYHLAVVVDDHLMKISHIIRAEEWISSTPKHVLLYQAFTWELPVFVHVPILRNPDKSKLSKRKNPVWASWYLEEGYLPEAVLNYLALMGWGHPEGKEIFTIDELMKVFELKDIQAVGPVFDLAKLTWMNQQYIQNLSEAELTKKLLDFLGDRELDSKILNKLLPLIKTRMQTLKEFDELTAFFFTDPLHIARSDVEKQIATTLEENLSKIATWSTENILEVMKSVLSEYSVRMPVLYYLITGKEKGLPLPDSLAILGKEKTLQILQKIRQ
jgi:glutamyl-tRNA synthetase